MCVCVCVACTALLMGHVPRYAHNLFVVVWVWVSYNEKFLEKKNFFMSVNSLIIPE